MRRLLVTGHRGLLGSACVRLLEEKYQIFSLDIDLRDRFAVEKLMQIAAPDYVIHCAAKVGGVKANQEKPAEFLLENLQIQNNVIEAAHNLKVERLIFIGTSCLFPREAAVPVTEESLLTGTFEPSVEAYSIAKLAGYRLCKAYREQYGDRFTTIAPANMYGPNDNYGPNAHVVAATIRKMYQAANEWIGQTMYNPDSKGPVIEVWGDGSAVREFIYVDDVASAIETVLLIDNPPDLVNVGTGLGVSIRELIADLNITSPYGMAIQPRWIEGVTGIPRKTFSIEKIKALGWRPKIALKEGLRLTWEDFLEKNPRGMTKL
jgi:GDP-L-fucose synthase